MRPPVVAGVDFSAPSRAALETAWSIAAERGTSLVAAHIYPGTTQFGLPASEELRRAQYLEAMARLEHLLGRHDPPAEARPVVREGDPITELTSLAEESGADLLVIGAGHTPAPLRWFTGSITSSLLERLPCDLLIADHFIRAYRRILVPVDTGSADVTLAAALSLASPATEIDVVDVSHAGAGRAVIARWAPAHPRLRLVGEVIRPARRRAAAPSYDLIAVAASKRSWLERLLTRSLAEEVAHDPPCSILVVDAERRPLGREAPVSHQGHGAHP